MASYVGRRRAPKPRRGRARRAVVVLTTGALGVVGAVATSSAAQSSTTTHRDAVAGMAAPLPVAFTVSRRPLPNLAAQAAESTAAVVERTRQSREQARYVASRRAATRAALASPGRQEEKKRAQDAARTVIAERTAAAARAKKVAKIHRWVLPINHPNLSSPFGHRWGRLHAGLDFSTPVGTPLVAMSSGVVTKAEYSGGYGLKVEIRYWDGTVSYFAHMSELSVQEGDLVAPGSPVGKSGNTGNSTGPHLHLEIHPEGGDPVDPAGWLAAHHLNP
ncbi:MAG: M23 family metallopeptidase [Tetrasphaera sp.]